MSLIRPPFCSFVIDMEPSVVTDWRTNYCKLNACTRLFVRLPGVLPSPGLRLRLHFIYKRFISQPHYPQQRCLWVFYFSNKSKKCKKIALDANQGLFKSYASIFLGRTTRTIHAIFLSCWAHAESLHQLKAETSADELIV